MTQRSTGHGDRPTDKSYSLPTNLLLVGVVLMAAMAGALGAVSADHGDSDNTLIDYDEGENPRIVEDTLTIAEHDQEEFDHLLTYYGDNGEEQHLDAHVNDSLEDPVGVRYDKVDDLDLREFPRNTDETDENDDDIENSASAIDADEWTTDAADTTGSIAVEDVTNNSVEGLRVEGSSIGTNEGGLVTYSNFTIDSDANKRVLTVVGRVEELGSDAQVNITAKESDGDYKRAYIDSNKDSGSTDVAATGTADGVVYQVKLSDLTTEGTGDGSFDAIDSVEINVTDGDAELALTGFDLGRKTKLDLGTVRSDTDGDGDDEDKEITQNADGGYERLTSLSTMDDVLSDATVHDLEVHDVYYSMEDLPADDPQNDTHVAFGGAADYPGYNSTITQYARLDVPTAIDLSHGNLELESEQALLADRYQSVEYAEDTGDTDFQNVSWTGATDSWDSQGDIRTFDSSVSAGQNYTVRVFYTLTDSERSNIESVSTAGGGGGPVDDGSGGLLGNPIAWIVGIVGSAWAAIKTFGSGGS